MSYRNLADQQVRQAFNKLKDLAEDAILYKKNALGFNFGAGQAIVADSGSITTKVIELKKERASQKTNVTSKTIMLKSSEVGSLTDYAEIELDGLRWKFGDPIRDSGYVLITTVFREASNGG